MMMRILMVSALAALCGLAQEPAKKSTTAAKKAPAKSAASKAAPAKIAKKAAPAAPAIPDGAKEIEPGTYRWVDPKGVAWIYTKTPFGIMKGPEKKLEAQPEGAATAGWRVTDLGENLEFERPYPFGGTYRWTRKKTELTDLESEFWQRSQATAQNK